VIHVIANTNPHGSSLTWLIQISRRRINPLYFPTEPTGQENKDELSDLYTVGAVDWNDNPDGGHSDEQRAEAKSTKRIH